MSLKISIDTPLGEMIAVADDEALLLLEFADRKDLARQLAKLPETPQDGENAILRQIRDELKSYFKGRLTQFQTPYKKAGTAFQDKVWDALEHIPSGQTVSYKDIAGRIQNPKAVRGAASAIGANPLAIMVPCHRVIGSDGSLTGYAGGLERKKWLLAHEGAL